MAFYDELNDESNFVASFTSNSKGDFGVFAKGYRLGAERLAESLTSAHRFADYEAYPVVFLYRHALELSLKHIIYSAALISAFQFSPSADGRLKNDHRLPPLASGVAQVLELLFPKEGSLRLLMREISEICDDWRNLDPHSYAYRYPIDIQGKPSTRQHQVVNLRSLAFRMSTVLESLETVHFGLNIETDKAQEIYETVQQIIVSISHPTDTESEG
ncbi:hypothetical protein [Nitrosococcus oceani]|uniref:hypothetical protein n=1 Tax=Nitrosococcus oceani TaxID=1229 RepID=UPI0004E8A67A|nr:hypothetical protein [Nitrosococcus oceani]KFI23624.1 hypothetical protein HW44_02855 [Nitrosococcus oceani]